LVRSGALCRKYTYTGWSRACHRQNKKSPHRQHPTHPEDKVIREETGAHLKYLDGWRGAAVSVVVFGHFWGDEHIWSGFSTLGVQLFFVLSGRLMAEILFVRKNKLPLFFARRFSRVYPGFLVFVVIATIALWKTPYAHGVKAALLALTFTLNYAMAYTHQVAALDHLWSLCVEEHSYIILAGIAFLSRRMTLPVIAIIAGLGVAALINAVISTDVLHQSFFLVHWRTDVAAAPIFLAGALWLVLRERAVPSWLSPVALALGIACRLSPYEAVNFGLAMILLALSVVTIDRSQELVRKIFAHPVICQIGLWSYSIYLWQQPFYKMNKDGVAPTAVLLAGAFLCALASFYLVERPARAWINRGFEPPKAQPV
jgi:peptidoglycan/LPS O-acetylase OafA/YrhL